MGHAQNHLEISLDLYYLSGGGLSVSHTIPGQLADFNLWQREMSEQELNSLSCSAEGDVSSFRTLEERGVSAKSFRTFPECQGKSKRILTKINI